MKIAIIGNSTPLRNYSKEIDTYDLVIRFSKLNFINSNLIGKKTDRIYINTNDNFIENLNFIPPQNKEFYKNAEVFLRIWDEKNTKQICENLEITKYKILEEKGTIDLITKKYGWPKVDGYFTSTGLMALVNILEEFPDTEIHTFCFNYNGDFGEFEFEPEFEFLLFLEYHKKIKIIS